VKAQKHLMILTRSNTCIAERGKQSALPLQMF